jgi:glycine betaine/proline transport system permease protein
VTALSLPAVRRLEVAGARRLVGLGLLALAAALYLLLRDQWTLPHGIVAGRSQRFSSIIPSVLDFMQLMTTFAYLAPMALLFGIGGGAAAIATMIYAVPATIRITALGIRGVPGTTLEAAESLGATRWQVLRNVQIPMARRVIGLAINQTIMLALGMVVITVLINAPGLGEPIIRALERVNVGAAFDAGLAIVVLAVLLDRLTEHASIRLDPRFRLSAARASLRRRVTVVLALASVAAVAAGRLLADPDAFPSAVSLSFRQPVNAITDWVKLNLFAATDAIKVGFTELFLNPLQSILTTSPWWLVVAVVFGLGVLISGWRPAIVATTALLLVAGLQLWEHGMETLASVLVATGITLVVGVLLGIWSARSNRFATGLRPVLDFAQTMPSFVYLLPAVALFGASRFTAIVAAVIYAAPPVIRLVDAGIRAVSPTILEAATATGATGRQLLWTVQLPLSRPALLLAANQGIVMVLSMVVIGGLVGAGALGFDVITGFARGEQFGKGLAAGVAIVLLGIMLDRITQGAGSRARPVRTAIRRAG